MNTNLSERPTLCGADNETIYIGWNSDKQSQWYKWSSIETSKRDFLLKFAESPQNQHFFLKWNLMNDFPSNLTSLVIKMTFFTTNPEKDFDLFYSQRYQYGYSNKPSWRVGMSFGIKNKNIFPYPDKAQYWLTYPVYNDTF